MTELFQSNAIKSTLSNAQWLIAVLSKALTVSATYPEDLLLMEARSYSVFDSKRLRVVVVLIVMIGLFFSPFLTLRLFHRDGASIGWPEKIEYLLDLQLSQLEPLLVSFAVVWYCIVYRNTPLRMLCISSVVIVHLVAAFYLISIRGEGGLRWF